MSSDFLDSKINHTKASKYGQRYDPKRVNYMKLLDQLAKESYIDNNSTKREEYIGIVLRVENSDDEIPYEPGSMPSKKYRGKTSSAPKLTSVKARIPELHYMLPIPEQLGNLECEENLDDMHIRKCWHPIIDMYPTFYAETDKILPPEPGDLVALRFGDLKNMQDPILLEAEIVRNFAQLPATNYGASGYNFSPSGGSLVPSFDGTDRQLTSEQIAKGREYGAVGPWGAIVSKDGWSYQLTDEDVFWAIKMAIGEGSHPDYILWSMANYLGWHNDPRKRRRFKGSSYLTLILAYSQPINPIWRRNGRKCAGKENIKANCRPAVLERRETYRSMRYEDMENNPKWREIKNLTINWAKGKVPARLPSAVTDFAVASVTKSKLLQSAGGTCNPSTTKCSFNRIIHRDGAVWYVGRPGTERWSRNHITITSP